MSVSPIGGVTNVSSLLQPTATQITGTQDTVPTSATTTAAQTAPTADAAQAWEEAMRAAMGDESSSDDSSSDPLSALATQNAAAGSMASLPSALAGTGATTGTTTGATTSAASLATPSGGAPLTSAPATAIGDRDGARRGRHRQHRSARAHPSGAGRAGLGQLDRAHQSVDHVVVGAERRDHAGCAGERRRELIPLSSAGTANAGRPPAHMIVAATR